MRILLLAVAYAVFGQASFMVSVSHSIVTLVVFAAEGVGLAFVLMYGPRVWPGIFIGQLILAMYNGLPLLVSLGISAINSAEALLGYTLFCRARLDRELGGLKDVGGLLLLIFLVLQPFSASLGVGWLWMHGRVPTVDLGESWFSWWFGNSMGQMLFTPFILSALLIKTPSYRKLKHTMLSVLALVAITWIFFDTMQSSSIALTFALFTPLLVLIAARQGIFAATLASVLIGSIALLATHKGSGPFVVGGSPNLLDLNLFLAGISITAQFIAIMFAELKRSNQIALEASQEKIKLGESLLESEERFHLMTNEIKDYAIILLDREGRVTSWNAGGERIKGYTEKEILGKPMTVFYSEADVLSGYPSMLLQTAEREGRAKDEGWRVRKDGSRFYASVLVTAMHDRSGNHIGFAKITHDITEDKKAEEALIQAKLAAEVANRAKSEFLANMSHEIRTPMNGVVGMTDLLLRTHLSDEQVKMALVIRDSAQTQLGILNDILDFSKIEAGKLEFSSEPFAIADAVEKTCETLGEYARKHGVTLRHGVDPAIPKAVEGDALRVRQILANFLSNAIKFSSGLAHPGEVEMAARLAGEDDGRVWIELSVRDNGIGMDAATLKRVFHPFAQADASTTRKYGGTGLGLVISMRLAEAMGGEIQTQSTPDVGSTFTARLPFVPTDESRLVAATDAKKSPHARAGVPSREEAIRQGRLILVVEDNKINQIVIQKQLAKLGYQCDVSQDGRTAFGQWLSGDYGLVLSDIHMPQMDGYQLAEAIRDEEAERGGGHTPILALTANLFKGEAERCMAAGMDGYLAKPVLMSELKGLLVRWLPAADAGTASENSVLEGGAEAPVFDPGMLTRMVGESPAIHKRLLEKFLTNAQEQAERLRAAIAAGDATAAGQIAHGLKSNARAVGAMRLGELCEKLEQAGKAGNASAVEALAGAFEPSLEVARETIVGILSKV